MSPITGLSRIDLFLFEWMPCISCRHSSLQLIYRYPRFYYRIVTVCGPLVATARLLGSRAGSCVDSVSPGL
ncbi:hypothetical protein BGL_1c25320 [Burkholderia plantarii]|uniref:Uncharacterized protein n=1 Tax=Burkholderia plantarii TaxID=41899 RepID=A0A0B6RNX1_BURPL|nr:hypothetical protein BGL_1c25320 [Burkholderia plantarii]